MIKFAACIIYFYINPACNFTCISESITVLFTSANKSGRIWGPGSIWWHSIWCTHCCPIPSWKKPHVTSEEYVGTTQCAWNCHNGAISRSSRYPTGDWKKFNCNEKLKRGSGRWVWRQHYIHDVMLHFGRKGVSIMASACGEGSILGKSESQTINLSMQRLFRYIWCGYLQVNCQKNLECTWILLASNDYILRGFFSARYAFSAKNSQYIHIQCHLNGQEKMKEIEVHVLHIRLSCWIFILKIKLHAAWKHSLLTHINVILRCSIKSFSSTHCKLSNYT